MGELRGLAKRLRILKSPPFRGTRSQGETADSRGGFLTDKMAVSKNELQKEATQTCSSKEPRASGILV